MSTLMYECRVHCCITPIYTCAIAYIEIKGFVVMCGLGGVGKDNDLKSSVVETKIPLRQDHKNSPDKHPSRSQYNSI